MIEQALRGVLPPLAVLAAALVAAGWRPRRPPRPFGAAFGLPLALLAASFALQGPPAVPPISGGHRLALALLALAVVAPFLALFEARPPLLRAAGGALSAGLLVAAAGGGRLWELGFFAGPVLVLGALACGALAGLAPAPRRDRAFVETTAGALLAAAAILLATSGSALYAQLAGALAAGAFGCAAAALAGRGPVLSAGAWPALFAPASALLALGALFAETPVLDAGLLALALALVPPAAAAPSPGRRTARLLPALVLAGIALWRTALPFFLEGDPYGF